MFAVYAKEANLNNPLASVVVGERPEPVVPEGWVRVRGHVFSELVPGTMADYVAVPRRNAIPMPEGLSPVNAAVLGTAWLTAYRALFTKSRLKPGETLLVQGASGGMATALIQMGRAAGFKVWATTRSEEGRKIALRLGADAVFSINEELPQRVEAAVDNVGAVSR